jgi:hypothetical protein
MTTREDESIERPRRRRPSSSRSTSESTSRARRRLRGRFGRHTSTLFVVAIPSGHVRLRARAGERDDARELEAFDARRGDAPR